MTLLIRAGGELFSQRFEGYTLHVTALFEQVVVSWARPGQPQREVGLAKETLDNRWHWIALRYRPNPPSVLLEVDKDTQVLYYYLHIILLSIYAGWCWSMMCDVIFLILPVLLVPLIS